MTHIELPDLSEFETEVWASTLGIHTGDAIRTNIGFAKVTNCYEFVNPADGKRRVAVAVYFLDGYKMNLYFEHGETVAIVKSACNKLSRPQAHALRQLAEFPGLTHYRPGRDYPSHARTKFSYSRFDMDRRRDVRCTDSVEALVQMGLVDVPTPERSCAVVLTQSGRAWIAAHPVA